MKNTKLLMIVFLFFCFSSKAIARGGAGFSSDYYTDKYAKYNAGIMISTTMSLSDYKTFRTVGPDKFRQLKTSQPVSTYVKTESHTTDSFESRNNSYNVDYNRKHFSEVVAKVGNKNQTKIL